MNDFLEWYFNWKFVKWFAFIILIAWTLFVSYYRRIHNKKSPFKIWWFWLVTPPLILNITLITYINPTYLGYGSPRYFELIQVTDEHIILYDDMYSYVSNENSNNNHDEYVPNLRVHIIDRETHLKLYSEMIGSYYTPLFYGNNIILLEQNTYSSYADDKEINSISYFDIEKRKVCSLASNNDEISVDGEKIKVFDIYQDFIWYFVKSVKSDVYQLDQKSMKFIEYDADWDPIPYNPTFYMAGSYDSPDKDVLYIHNKSSDVEFIDGRMLNERILDSVEYVLIYAQTDLNNENPYISLVNDKAEILWEKDLVYFNKLEDHNEFDYIHRTTLTDGKCYVTMNEYLYEFDLITGDLNWTLKL